MKKITLILTCFLLLTVAKSGLAQPKEKWPELEAFHEVMSKTFHLLLLKAGMDKQDTGRLEFMTNQMYQ